MKKSIYIVLLYSTIIIGCNGHNKWEVMEKMKPEKEDSQEPQDIDWDGKADSCTFVLIDQFMNEKKGTFWATTERKTENTYNIYWQQAHAIDVLIYSYERIRDKDKEKATEYEKIFRLWYNNKGNNYNKNPNDETGFLNPFTDDMCWICLTLIHMSEATGDDTYINTAKTVYDKYIITRAKTDENGTGLPWNNKSDDKGNKRNACTNSPGCLVAAKLYNKYNEKKYLDNSIMLYDYVTKNLLKDDGRVEEPPLTYTQGTFGEACRQLYHITNDRKYMNKAEMLINYAINSSRCLKNGILRDEGHDMNQSIFKAVFVPYAVNLALDDEASTTTRESIILFLEKQAETLWNNLDKSSYPQMYCNYYWGAMFPTNEIASMGAQASGASLMENVARMNLNIKK